MSSLSISKLRQYNDCLDEMMKRLDEALAMRRMANDVYGDDEDEDDLLNEQLGRPEPFFADRDEKSLPEAIHGQPDAAPEMPKENLWEGHPPIPIEHL
jgi:hypothetical protein